MTQPSFSERLARREALWWKSPSLLSRAGRLAAIHRPLSKSTPLAQWKRGDRFWQRRLSNKWNARNFSELHGVDVPALYWHGRRAAQIPFGTLPAHFVIRPVFGNGDQGVFVVGDGVNLFYPGQHNLGMVQQAVLRESGRWSAHRLMVEEFLRSEDGTLRLLDGYQFHAFGGRIALVEVTERRQESARPDLAPDEKIGSYGTVTSYTPDWQPYAPGLAAKYTQRHQPDPPHCYAEMLSAAQTLGRAYESYVRVDLYATERGCVFGEFSTLPYRGRGFTPEADALLGEVWAQEIDEHS